MQRRRPRPGSGATTGATSNGSPERIGRIVNLPADELPERERLRPLESVRATAAAPAPGAEHGFTPTARQRIVGDWIDGQLSYPEPPPVARRGGVAARLVARTGRPTLIWIALAAVQAATVVADFVAAGWTTESVADALLRLAYISAVTLLPAAVLVWRRDAWRSIRLVLLGAIAWTTIPAIAGLAWWFVRRSPELLDRAGAGFGVLVAAGSVAAFAGPWLVAFGLGRVRGKRPFVPDISVIVALVILLACNALRWTATIVGNYVRPNDVAFQPLNLPGTVSAMALPLEVFSLFVLAAMCIPAVVAHDVPARFWQCATAAVAVLLTGSLYELATGAVLGGPATSGLAARAWDASPGIALPLAGHALLLLAFLSPVWSAEGEGAYWRAVPEGIFDWGAAAEVACAEKVALGTIAAVAVGTDHALALDEDGRVAAWGSDEVGQCAIPAGLVDAVAVAAGDGFSLALRRDGTVVAWGAKDAGQIAVPAGLSNVTAVAAGLTFTLALTADGSVVGWGSGPAIPVPPGLTGVVAIAAGARHCLALRADGHVVAWGDGSSGQTAVPVGLSHVKAISAGRDFSLALCAEGTVEAWGDGTFGQLDIPDGLHDVVAISAGSFHALALRADGDVVGWGGGGRKVGEALHPWRLLDFRAVAAGDQLSLAIRASNTRAGWTPAQSQGVGRSVR